MAPDSALSDRADTSTIHIHAPSESQAGRPFAITAQGTTGAARYVYLVVKAEEESCGESYGTDSDGEGVSASPVAAGAFRLEQTEVLSVGRYLLCGWLQDAEDALSAAASSSVIFTVSAPTMSSESEPIVPFPAKLKVLRASVNRGVLDALLSITGRATGFITIDYQAAGVFSRFLTDVGPAREGEKRIRVLRAVDARQRYRRTGILNAGFAGNVSTQPDSVRIRAAGNRSRLVMREIALTEAGLKLSGTIGPRLAGGIRVRATYLALDGSIGAWTARIPVTRGTWSLERELPLAVALDPNAYLTIQFTGDAHAAGGPYAGEQVGKSLGNLNFVGGNPNGCRLGPAGCLLESAEPGG